MATTKTIVKKTPVKKVTSVADKPKPKAMEAHEIVLSTVMQNAVGVLSWSKFAGEANLGELVQDLDKQINKIKDGDMSSVEAMLFGQAKTLETMFTSLARRAANNDGLKQFQVNLTLALKAQAQCRSTLEALAEVKNPRSVAFVKQANIANGPQQVNNGATLDQATHARETQPQQNELLEDQRHGSTHLDTRTTEKAARSHQEVETVEAVHRAKKPGR